MREVLSTMSGAKRKERIGMNGKKLYYRRKFRAFKENARLRDWLSAAVFFLTLVGLDAGLRFTHRGGSVTGFLSPIPWVFTLAWALMLTALVKLLPQLASRIAMGLIGVSADVLFLTHALLMKAKGNFFTFSVLIFASMELTDMLPLLLKERKELTAQSCLTDRNLEQVKAFFLAHWQETTEHYREQIVAGGEYFARILRGCERACAVDVGWAGSGAMALRCLIEKEWHIPCRLTGLLAGTNTVHNAEPDTGEAQLASGALASYLFSSSSNRDLWEYHDLNRGDNLYLELLMSSPHPSFKGFGRGEKGEVTYLFGEPEKNQEGVRQIQKGVLDFASLYSQAFEKYPYLLNISGRDAYAPLAAAGGKRQAYLKKVYEAFELKVGI